MLRQSVRRVLCCEEGACAVVVLLAGLCARAVDVLCVIMHAREGQEVRTLSAKLKSRDRDHA